MTPARPDAGSATVWVLTCCVLLLTVGAASVVRGAAVVARHRAESAADLAALAAADRIGTGTDGADVGGAICRTAARIAARNGTRLTSCRVRLAVDGRSGTVRVRVSRAVTLPLAGRQVAVAGAVAGRLPAAGSGSVAGAARAGPPGRRDPRDRRPTVCPVRPGPVAC